MKFATFAALLLLCGGLFGQSKKDEIIALNYSKDSLEKVSTAHRVEIEDLKNQIRRINAANAELESDLSAEKKKKNELNGAIKSLEVRVAMLESELKAVRSKPQFTSGQKLKGKGKVISYTPGFLFDKPTQILKIRAFDNEEFFFGEVPGELKVGADFVGKIVEFTYSIKVEEHIVCFDCADQRGKMPNTAFVELKLVDGNQGDVGIHYSFRNRNESLVNYNSFDIYDGLDILKRANPNELSKYYMCGIKSAPVQDKLISIEVLP